MRRLLAAVTGLMIGALTALPGTVAAHAAPVLAADLQVTASGASGHIDGSVEVRLVVRNNGPSPVVAETWQLVITAPPGTRIGGGSALAGSCEQNDREARCRYPFGLRRGERHELKLGLRIQAQPSGCGRAEVNYGSDPRDRNNAANIRVTVGGQPRSCAAGSEQSPTPKPSTSVAATPEAGEVTEAPDDAPASAEVLPALPADDSTGGLSLAGILVIGGGLVLVALGGLLIWRLMRRDPDEDYEEDDGGYPPTTAWNTGTTAYGGGDTTQWNPGQYQQRPGQYPPDGTGPTYGR